MLPRKPRSETLPPSVPLFGEVSAAGARFTVSRWNAMLPVQVLISQAMEIEFTIRLFKKNLRSSGISRGRYFELLGQ